MTMHAALNRGSMAESSEALFFATVPDAAGDASALHVVQARGGFAERKGPNWVALAIIAALHVVTLVALVKLDIISVQKPRTATLTVIDIAEVAPPPKDIPKAEKPVDKIEPQVVTPVAMVQTIAPPPPPIQVSSTPPAPKPVVSTAPPTPPGPVVVSDLNDPIYRPPFSPPMEARRKGKGLRTVTVRLVIGLTGQVETSELAQSSGVDSLDDSVVKWVRKWRFAPVIRNNEAVQARAIVPISINVT